jgi:hypothetical protein
MNLRARVSTPLIQEYFFPYHSQLKENLIRRWLPEAVKCVRVDTNHGMHQLDEDACIYSELSLRRPVGHGSSVRFEREAPEVEGQIQRVMCTKKLFI